MIWLRVMMLARQSSSTCAKPENFQRLLHVIEQFLLVDGLRQKAERAALGRVDRVGDRAVRGQNDDAQARPAALQLFEQADAVHVVHAQVGDHEVGAKTHAGRERRGRALDRFDFVVLGAQPDRQEPEQARVVVDDEDAGLALLGGHAVTLSARQTERERGGGGIRISVHGDISQ